MQEGGEAPPKFEIFCVITCGLTTHKISIAAPAEAGHLYITTRKLTWRDVKRDGGTFLETWSGLVIMPMSAFSGNVHRGKKSPSFFLLADCFHARCCCGQEEDFNITL